MIGVSWGGFNSLQVASPAAAGTESNHHGGAPPTTAMPTTCHYMGGCRHHRHACPGAQASLPAARPSARSPPLSASVGATCGGAPARRARSRRSSSTWLHASARATISGSTGRSARIIGDRMPPSSPSAAGLTAIRMPSSRMIEGVDLAEGAGRSLGATAGRISAFPVPQIGSPPGATALVGSLAQGRPTPGSCDEPGCKHLDAGQRRAGRHLRHRPGRWAGEPAWPAPTSATSATRSCPPRSPKVPALRRGRSLRSVAANRRHRRGEWCPLGLGGLGPLPLDQRKDDGGSLVSDFTPLPSHGDPRRAGRDARALVRPSRALT